MKRIRLDFGKCSSKQAVHEYLKEQFGFPDYYGGNLDALYDCLTDLAEDTGICFEEEPAGACRDDAQGQEGLEADEKVQQYLKKVRRVISDAAEENSHLYL